ncbi:MAG TPA: AsmA family protein [Steroidobacteraceae bacterium]|nr:AsmA family protein [Steroidobacteraceae bacterium]
MRLLRYALYALGGVLLLVAAALAYVLVFFDPNAHKQQLEQLVRDQTGREFSLPGELKLRLYPWLAIEMGRATLGNAPGFGTEPMVEFERAQLGVKLLPLLHGNIEIGAVTVESPTIRLGVDAAGHDNWSDLGKGKGGAPASPAGGAPKLSIASVHVANGNLRYLDRKGGSDIAVHGLNLETGALQAGSPFDVQLAGTVQQGKSLTVALELRGQATMHPDTSRYELDAPVLKLQLSGDGFPAAGLPVELRFTRIAADLDAQTLDLPGMDVRAAGAQLSGSLHGAKIVDAPSFSGPVQLAKVSLRELLDKFGTKLPATRDPAVFGAVSFSGTLAASSKAIMLSGLKLRLDDTNASGRAGISDLDTTALAFDLQVDRINADRYLAPVPAGPARPPAAAAAASPPTPIPVELLRSLNMHGSIAVGQAVFAGIQYQNLRVGLNAAGGRVRVFPSEAQMYGGQYHGDINIDASGKLARVSFDEHVDGVDFAPLFRDMFETRHISGRGNAAIRAAGVGADSAALLRTLSGNVEFHVDNGAYEGLDLWYEIRRARALLKQEAIPARTGPERTPFTAVSATGKITNGVLANEDLIAALQYLQVKGHGTADIASGTLDYHLDATVLKIPDNAADAGGAADLSGYTIPVTVSGSFGAPKVRPDVAALAKARVQKELDKRKDELKQKLQDKLQDKLKGLFGN